MTPPMWLVASAMALGLAGVLAAIRTRAGGLRVNVLALSLVMLAVVALVGGLALHVLDAAPPPPPAGIGAEGELEALEAERRWRRAVLVALAGLGSSVVSALALATGALLRGGNDAVAMARVMLGRELGSEAEDAVRRLESEAARHGRGRGE